MKPAKMNLLQAKLNTKTFFFFITLKFSFMKLSTPLRLLRKSIYLLVMRIAFTLFKPAHALSLLALTLLSVHTVAQNNTVSGTVKNTDGEPVAGAAVKVEKTTTQTVTDSKGNFSIKANTGQTLTISSIGYNDYAFTIKDSKPINITLSVKYVESDDVVVVGYLQQKRPDVSTAISTVSPKNADKGGYSNFQQILGGRAAGVNVMENNSEPGGGINIEVRGPGSITGSTQPLYVIDGVPIEMPDMNLSNTGGTGTIASLFGNNLTANPLSMLNPNDIENIEILKDAAATSLYGSRGANGVVVITTKSGKVGKPKIVFNYNQSVNTPQKRVDILGATDYANYVNEGWMNRRSRVPPIVVNTADTPYLASEIANLKDYDHQKSLAGSSVTRDASISISGGAIGGAKYYVSGQYFDQQGVIPGTYLKRYSGRINYEMPVNTKLTLNVSLGVTSTDRFGTPTQTLTSRALNWAPTTPLVNPDGGFNYLWDYRYGNGTGTLVDPRFGTVYYNPRFTPTEITTRGLDEADGTLSRLNPLLISSDRGVQNANKSSQILGTVSLKYKFNNELSMQGKVSVNQFNSLLQTFIPNSIPLLLNNYRGEASSGTSQNNSILYQLNFNYSKRLSVDHTINAALVFSAEKFVQTSQRSLVGNFVNNITGFNNLASAIPQNINSSYNKNQLVGNILQLNYLYKRSVVVNLSARYDGSSKFADGNKWGIFPATSIAWKMQQEKWFKALKKVVSEAKLRASWGLVGNQAISPYETQATYSANNNQGVIGGNNAIVTGFSPTRLANRALTWETTSNTNLALDIGFLNNRITASFEAYRRRTKNLLFQVQLPPSVGFSTMSANLGTLLNEGLELTLGAKIINKRDFKWSVEGNVNFNRNVVERLRNDVPNEFYTAGNIVASIFVLRVQKDQNVGAFYGYKSLGLWGPEVATAPASLTRGAREGERKYADLNGDGILNDADRTWLGSALPKAFGGFNTSITYKNFELTAYFSYAYGQQIFNQFQINWGNMNGLNNVRKDTYNSRYRYIYPGMDPKLVAEIQESNKTATSVFAGTTADQRESTDYFIENADYFRCRDISLSYKFPPSVTKRLRLQGLQVYGNVQNLFIITKYTGFNPEIGASSGRGFARGIDNGAAPLALAYRFGFNVTL